jgi:hypothetical protein
VNTLQAQVNRNYAWRLLKEKQPRFAAALESVAWEFALNAKYSDGTPGTGARQRNGMACAIKEGIRPGALGGRRQSCSHDPLTNLSSV